MSKAIEIDGKLFRNRRGKLVEIPEAWIGEITTKKTIRNRASKLTHKARRSLSGGGKIGLKWIDGRYGKEES